MRKLLLAILLASLGASTGCLKMHMETVIEADGSGTCTVTYGMTREVADAIVKMSELNPDAMGEDGEMPSLKDLTRDKVEAACKKAGVKLVDHQYTDDATGNHLTMKLAFTDVSQLSAALNGVGGSNGGDQQSLGIYRTDDGNFVLKSVLVPGDESASEDDDEETAGEGADDMANMQEAMQYMGVLMAHMSELDVRMTVTVPGDVISSNAPEVEGRTSIWAVNAANMMSSQETDMEPEIVFSSQGLKLKPTGK